MSYSYIPADSNKQISSEKDTLLNFKYTGGTDSLTYQYLWSPFAEYLLKFIPTWVAPNLITFAGLLILFVTNILFMWPDQDDVIPSWKLILMSVSIIVYQHLDNVDGKQARKTKSSSPLGMLFDHGADAVSAFLLAMQFMKILHISYPLQLLSIFLFIMSTYFCAMWSQYCVGFFKLGRINPVDEGLPIYAIFSSAVIFIDQKIFTKQHKYGTYAQELMLFFSILLVFQVAYMTKDIFKKRIVEKSEVLFMPLLYITTGIAILLVYLRVPVLNRPVFYAIMYSLTLMWSRNMINIQLQFITKQKYRVFNRGTLSFLVLCGFYVLFSQALGIDAYTYFVVVCFIQAIAFFQFCARVLHQGAQILGIRIFSLKPRLKKD